jgi:hypothetical protein
MQIELVRTATVSDDDHNDATRYYSRNPLESHPTLEAFAPLGLSGLHRVNVLCDFEKNGGVRQQGPSFDVVMRPEMSLIHIRKAVQWYEAWDGVNDIRIRPDGVIEVWMPA